MPGRLQPFAAASAIALACLAASCSSTQTSLNAPTADKCQVGVSSAPSAFTATGGQGSLTITTARDCTWSISTEAGWISITGDRGGQGEASVPYAIAPNPAPTPRSAVVAVGSQTVTLNQAPAPCQFTLSRPGDAISYAGGRMAFDVTTLTGCGWSASTGDAWIAVTSGTSGTASGTVGLSVSPNTGPARVGRVNVAGQNYTVTQSGPPAPPPAPNPPAPAPPPPAPQPTPAPTPTPAPQPTPTPPPPPPPPPPNVGKKVDFDGTISSLAGFCPGVRFTVNGVTVETDFSTDFKKSDCGDLRNGRSVSGEGVTRADGSIRATRIEVKKHDD